MEGAPRVKYNEEMNGKPAGCILKLLDRCFGHKASSHLLSDSGHTLIPASVILIQSVFGGN